MQFKLLNYQFKSHIGYLALLIVCVVTFIKLGFWQYNKAVYKQHIEDAYHASVKVETKSLTDYLSAPATLEFKKAKVTGHYETQYQMLIDNKVEQSRAGFHVITPFKIASTNQYVLVNRGWIAGLDNHQSIPAFDTPTEKMEIQGMVWKPSTKIFTLEKAGTQPQKWQRVWQHLDMKKYHASSPLDVLDVIIKLDPAQETGGFVRNWQLPPSKIATHLGYAYQWFGFAVAAILIYLYQSIQRINRQSTNDE